MSITGDRLRSLRESKGMSQEAVANFLGISRTAYNKYESGVIKPVRKLEGLSLLFGVSADYFEEIFGGDLEKILFKIADSVIHGNCAYHSR